MRPALLERVVPVLPGGERFLGGVEVHRAMSHGNEDDADVPPARRPRVFGEVPPMSGDRTGGFLSFLFASATGNEPKAEHVRATGDRSARLERQRKSSPFFGEWDSLAGRWLAAGQPRSKTGVVTVLVLTDSRLRMVCVQRRRGGSKLGDAVATGEAFDRGALTWTRRYSKGWDDFQFGFRDGSWGTFMIPDDRDFLELFPGTLGPKDPIP